MQLLNLKQQPEDFTKYLENEEVRPRRRNIFSCFTCAFLYLNKSDKTNAVHYASRIINNQETRDSAEGRSLDYLKYSITSTLYDGYLKDPSYNTLHPSWKDDPEFLRLQYMFHFLYRLVGERQQADELLFNNIQSNLEAGMYNKYKYDNGFFFYINLRNRNWDVVVDGISKHYTEPELNKKFIDMPYKRMPLEYFFGPDYCFEFCKMMVKKDYSIAGSMLGKFKKALEHEEPTSNIFETNDQYYFRYCEMLEALSEVDPSATKLIDDYMKWKESIGW